MYVENQTKKMAKKAIIIIIIIRLSPGTNQATVAQFCPGGG
jgi:hypothetical protein